MCLEGFSSLVPQNLGRLECISNVAKSRGTRIGRPLGLTNGFIGSHIGGSDIGGGVTMVVPSSSTLLLCSVSLNFSFSNWGNLWPYLAGFLFLDFITDNS